MAKFGSSLPVPCVQELAKKPMLAVPPRYIRPQQDRPVISDAALLSKLPVIDFQSLLSKESQNSELAKLDFACKEWGFFQLVNHGVSSLVVERAKKEMEEFFNLSMEEKSKYWQHPGKLEGFGQDFLVSEDQKLNWGDLFLMNILPVQMRKPHLFPKLPPSFRETLEVYSMELKSLSMTMVLKMAKVLNIKDEEMREFFDDGLQTIRMNYYPPCLEPEKVIGLGAHSDGNALTILLQVSEVEGLQILKDGNWIPITPLPNAFIVIIGDMLEIVTNGAYSSIEHRATVNSSHERLSLATFYSPRYDGDVHPASSLISEKTPAAFTRVRVEEFLKSRFARLSRNKSHLDLFRI